MSRIPLPVRSDEPPRAQPRAAGPMAALSVSIETITVSENTGVGRRPLQIPAVVLKHCWMLWRQRCKVVDGLVGAGGKAGSRDVVSEDAMVHYLREGGCARNQIAQHVGYIFLAFRCKGLLIAGTAAKSDYHYLFVSKPCSGTCPWPEQGSPKSNTCGVANEFASCARDTSAELLEPGHGFRAAPAAGFFSE